MSFWGAFSKNKNEKHVFKIFLKVFTKNGELEEFDVNHVALEEKFSNRDFLNDYLKNFLKDFLKDYLKSFLKDYLKSFLKDYLIF